MNEPGAGHVSIFKRSEEGVSPKWSKRGNVNFALMTSITVFPGKGMLSDFRLQGESLSPSPLLRPLGGDSAYAHIWINMKSKECVPNVEDIEKCMKRFEISKSTKAPHFLPISRVWRVCQ